ncbi:MAG: PGPGW domain-containing protein [candidate division NC10 bacterium]|nr:PGPGW domain-containing protein [candidate division NC10 bacterium]MDE2181280.1 PGPGW domain-containing protein [candidate division NC10 bacterium]MDE2484127.1 PGPGW domain-containing protein [candidate division NC10 bacterium]
MHGFMIKTLNQAKRVIVIVVGFTVLLFGITLIVLPGPAVLVIPIGLAILATEFVWARRLLVRFRWKTRRLKHTISRKMHHNAREHSG